MQYNIYFPTGETLPWDPFPYLGQGFVSEGKEDHVYFLLLWVPIVLLLLISLRGGKGGRCAFKVFLNLFILKESL
jgi:hypothetical protein